MGMLEEDALARSAQGRAAEAARKDRRVRDIGQHGTPEAMVFGSTPKASLVHSSHVLRENSAAPRRWRQHETQRSIEDKTFQPSTSLLPAPDDASSGNLTGIRI